MRIAGVVIGRNEGERLKRCLTTLGPQVERLVYVDSGSSDESVAFARSVGAEVVELDLSRPFTAARARNAGVEALRADDLPEAVLFVDGDCAVVEGWVAAAAEVLAADAGLGLVTGWRSEVHPEASIFNRIADAEWRQPAGPIIACGGDMLVRSAAFDAVRGFDAGVIAAEDDDFCLRLAKAGWRLVRIPHEMTRHDLAMTKVSQWWRRSVRGGHAFAEMGVRHPPHLARERRRAVLWGMALPLLAILGAGFGPWLPGIVALLYLAKWARTAQRLRRKGLAPGEAAARAFWYSAVRLPEALGMATYWTRRLRGHGPAIIEYK